MIASRMKAVQYGNFTRINLKQGKWSEAIATARRAAHHAARYIRWRERKLKE